MPCKTLAGLCFGLGRIYRWRRGDCEQPAKNASLFGSGIVSVVLFFAGWLWSIGTFLSSIAEPALRLNIHFFRFAIIFAGAYLPLTLRFHLSPKPLIGVLMLPLLLFAFFCWIYTYYFVSKSLVAVEKNRAVTRKDYGLTMFMLWFGFFGVWEIQPRINRLYAANHV